MSIGLEEFHASTPHRANVFAVSYGRCFVNFYFCKKSLKNNIHEGNVLMVCAQRVFLSFFTLFCD